MAPKSRDTTFLDALPDLMGERVLILGPEDGLVEELLQRGCRDVICHPGSVAPCRHDADAAILASIDDTAGVPETIARARYALMPCGRVLVRTAPAMASALAVAAIRALRQNGFSSIRGFRAGERAVVTAELPLFGRVGLA